MYGQAQTTATNLNLQVENLKTITVPEWEQLTNNLDRGHGKQRREHDKNTLFIYF